MLMATATLKQLNVNRYNEGKLPIKITNMSKDSACTAFERTDGRSKKAM
jgi:hypothetical protein